jgi:hypothetical protein
MFKPVFPAYDFKIKEEGGKPFIFDNVRKRWISLSPEEWVRQNFLQYLLQVKQYPAALIAVEKEIAVGHLKKRCDIVIYKNDKPWMIVECKEKDTPLTSAVLEQVLRYNIPLQVQYLVITNGHYNYAWESNAGIMKDIDDLPLWIY